MTLIDGFILFALFVSAVISFTRGFYREFMSLAVWVFATMITLAFSSKFASLLPDSFESPQARLGISACILFFCTLLVGGLATWLFLKVLAKRQAGKFDRIAGILFGLARGFVIVLGLVLLVNLTPAVKQDSWWKESALLPGFQNIAKSVHKVMPDDLATHFSFSS